jgi:CBS domain-containing protein
MVGLVGLVGLGGTTRSAAGDEHKTGARHVGLLQLGRAALEVPASATVSEAVKILVDGNQGALTVVDGRKVIGLFTERDLLRRVVRQGKDPVTTRISEVMSHPVHTALDSTPVVVAATLMRERHFRHLPIVDNDGNLEGMVALRYLLYSLMDELELKVGDLYRFIMADGPGG